jgi:LacI family transcriptional regulator
MAVHNPLLKPKTPRVLVLVESSTGYGRRLLEGIGRYALEHGPWSIYLEEHGQYRRLPHWMHTWRGDGIIVRGTSSEMIRALRKTGAPMVETDRLVKGFNLPLVYVNEELTAEAAADHFLERGLTSLAYCNISKTYWSGLRGDAFAGELAKRGLPCNTFLLPKNLVKSDWGRLQTTLVDWLRKLPNPVGILAENDICGYRLLDACRLIDLAVPEQVAVLGVDNNFSLCRITSPPLSSVDTNVARIGYEAGALLERMMRGEKPPAEPVLINPLGVVARQSTDVLAVDDPELASALRYIRERACEGIDVHDVLNVVAMSRRVLERRFQASLGRTPKDEIRRVRMNRARELLSQTDLPIARIARQTGFSSPAYLANVFTRQFDISPSAYRQSTRVGSSPVGPAGASAISSAPARRGHLATQNRKRSP